MKLARSRPDRRTTLKENMTRSIARKIGNYLNGEQTLANLSIELRESVLLEFVQVTSGSSLGGSQDFMARLEQALSHLTSAHTKKFKFGGLLSSRNFVTMPQDITKVLEVLSTKAKNLELLKINVKRKVHALCPMLESKSIEAICKLVKLRILKISNFVVQYQKLKSICKVLINLRSVNVRFISFERDMEPEDLDADIEDLKLSFSRLKEFLFSSLCSENPLIQKLTTLCVQHLPQLEIVNDFAESVTYFSNLESTEGVKNSDLRHLGVYPTHNSDLSAVFPKVTHLKVLLMGDEPEENINSILHFSNIESLNFHSLPSVSVLDRFFGAYGANLLTLILSCDWQSLSFSRIFAACPKLQVLKLDDVVISDDKEPIKEFAQLTELKWTLRKSDGLMPKSKVCNILSALPNLKKLSLSDWTDLEIDDLNKLTALIAGKKILGELTRLDLESKTELEDGAIDVKLFRVFVDLIANAAAYLQNLAVFRLNLCYMKGKIAQHLKSKQPLQIGEIGEKFQDWIGDKSIADFIRVINRC
ncbi:uncharacterized protein LOC135945608 [Cloeon dipterum]|uniref:uncharacterized protein LOC135945608 n=1 Tax=Cloeon dipterum TaxID=197152 RepID=UPI00321FDE32